MSLAAAGLANHPVTSKGIEFLTRSVRDDGSWPIDTNLSTWLTTLDQRDAGATRVRRSPATAGLAARPAVPLAASYTNAASGGWAWTDLPGGVPDADDTSGALLALHNLGDIDATVRSAAWLASAGCLICRTATAAFRPSAEAGAHCCLTAAAPILPRMRCEPGVSGWRIARRSAAPQARDRSSRLLSCEDSA